LLADELCEELKGKKFDVVGACWLMCYAGSTEMLGLLVKKFKEFLKEGGVFLGL